MNKYIFKSNLLLTLIAIIFFVFFIYLGFWQLHRSEEKEQILDKLQSKLQQKPIRLKDLSNNSKSWQYQPVKFDGLFHNKQQFLLDNRIHKGKVGYEVITPVSVPGLSRWVLVDRGWIPGTQNRNILPQVKPVFGSQKIHGIIRLPLGKGIILKAESLENKRWPFRIQQVDFKLMSKALGKPVYPFLIMLDKDAANGFVREWQFVNMEPAKHIGYAVQWFVFAGVLLIIYFALSIKRRETNNDTSNAIKSQVE